MKLTVQFAEIDAQRRRIGAPLLEWNISITDIGPRKELLDELDRGVDVERLDDVEVGPGPLLTYKDEQILLYIKDTGSDRWTLENQPWNSRRFHITDCSTLEKMRREQRFERYVITNNMSGNFRVDYRDEMGGQGETISQLRVCMNCLQKLSWRGYRTHLLPSHKIEIRESFSIEEFLSEYSTFFRTKPLRRDSAPLNQYVHNWPSISYRMKRAAEWRCNQCGVQCLERTDLLHCHHVSGVVTDNLPSNLRVLCALCHSDQPGHRHLGISTSARDTIQSLRAEQGIEA